MIEKLWLASPCGLYCGECSAFQDGTCKGCRSNLGICLKYRKVCGIYMIAVLKENLIFVVNVMNFHVKSLMNSLKLQNGTMKSLII